MYEYVHDKRLALLGGGGGSGWGVMIMPKAQHVFCGRHVVVVVVVSGCVIFVCALASLCADMYLT